MGSPRPCKHGRGTHPSGQGEAPLKSLHTLSGHPLGAHPTSTQGPFWEHLTPLPGKGFFSPHFPRGIFQAGWRGHVQEDIPWLSLGPSPCRPCWPLSPPAVEAQVKEGGRGRRRQRQRDPGSWDTHLRASPEPVLEKGLKELEANTQAGVSGAPGRTPPQHSCGWLSW